MFAEQLLQLTKELEIPTPPHPENGCSFFLDDSSVRIEPGGNGFQFMATIGTIPSENVELFFAKMLRGNLFSQATYGATLGLDENGNKIILRYYYPYKHTYRDIKEKLEDFMNSIDFWKAEVVRHQANPNAL